MAHSLYGHCPPALWPLLDAGMEELSRPELEALVAAVTHAQAVLRDRAMSAAFDSGRAQVACPDFVGDIIDYRQMTIKLMKESA